MVAQRKVYRRKSAVDIGDGMDWRIEVKDSDERVGALSLKEIAALEDSCAHCRKILSKSDIRILPPRSVQERDRYVRDGLLPRRYLCVSCYTSTRSATRERIRNEHKKTLNSVVNALLLQNYGF